MGNLRREAPVLLKWLFGSGVPESPRASSKSSAAARPRRQVNTELVNQYLRFSLRQILVKHTIPGDWILVGAEPSMDGTGVAARLVVSRCEPQILNMLPALQAELARKLASLDPKLPKLIRGYSWDIRALADGPQNDGLLGARRAEPGQRRAQSIASPQSAVTCSAAQMTAREHLDMLFAANRSAERIHDADFAPTQPAERD